VYEAILLKKEGEGMSGRRGREKREEGYFGV